MLGWLLMAFKPYRRRLVLNALQFGPNQNIQISYTAALYFGDEANIETADAFLKEKTGMTLNENFNLFFNDVCSVNVVFVIKLISLNSSSLAFRDILNHLWELYLDLDDLKMKDVTQRPVMALKRRPPDGEPYRRRPTLDESADNPEKEKFIPTEKC